MASCSADYAWARNTQGMDPCSLASRLKAVCRPDPTLSPIGHGQSYPVPSSQDQTDCSCSSVVYYLTAACADCQHGAYGTWRDWAVNCRAPAVDYYPRPAPDGVQIPNWAYFDVGTVPKYDPAFAKANSPSPPAQPQNPGPTTTQNPGQPAPSSASGDNPSPTPSNSLSSPASGSGTGSGTDTSTSTSTTGSNSSTASNTSAATDTNASGRPDASGSQTITSSGILQSGLNAAYSSDTLTGPGHTRINNQPTGSSGGITNEASGAKKSDTGIIAAGVIAALLLIAVLGGALFWWIARRRRRRIAPSAAYLAAYGTGRPDTSMSTRALTDRSASVLNINQTNTDAYPLYRDEEEPPRNTLAPTSEAHYYSSRASSLDHYRTS